MKLNSIYRSILLTIPVLFLGCSSLLDIEAENSLSGNIFETDQNFEDALNGAYVNLGGIYDGADGGELYGGDFQLMGTLLSRNINTLFFWRASEAPNYQDFMDKDILDINLRVESNWRRAYETINIVNGIITNIDNMDDSSLRTRIEGEARAIRGILYFELVRFWAPQYEASTVNERAVPILLAPIGDVNELPDLTLATVAEVYSRATTDLEDAEELLDATSFAADRINVMVCRAFLARVAMQQNDFSTALGYLDQVIGGSYELEFNPMDAFNNTAISTEDVFVIQQNSVSTSGNIATRTGLVAHLASLPSAGFAALNINYELLGRSDIENSPAFAPTDPRYALQENLNSNSSVDDINDNAALYNDVINTTQVSTAKFLRTDANIPVIRLAEMLLSRAEAALEADGFTFPVPQTALDDLNAVRMRSGLFPFANTVPVDTFYDSLIAERNRELLFEGIYFHDLKRWAVLNRRTFTISGRDPRSDLYILPIPLAECDASPGLCD